MLKLLTSRRGSDDLSFGFDRDRGRRQRELTNNENIKGNYHVRIYIKDIIGLDEHRKTATFGLGYKLTLTKNTDNVVINKDNAINNAKVEIIGLDWYIPHYSPSLEEL